MPRIFKGSESTLRLLIHTCNQEGKISDLKIALYTNDPSVAIEFTDRYTIDGNIVSLTVPNYAFGTMEDGVINYVAQGMIDDDTFLTERQSNYFLKTPANYTPTPKPEEVVLGGFITTIVENGVFEYTPTDVDAWDKATIEVNVLDTNGSYDEGYNQGYEDGQNSVECPEGGSCNLEEKWITPSMGDMDGNGLIVVEKSESFDGLSMVVLDPSIIYNEGHSDGYSNGYDDGQADCGGGGETTCRLEHIEVKENGYYEPKAQEFGYLKVNENSAFNTGVKLVDNSIIEIYFNTGDNDNNIPTLIGCEDADWSNTTFAVRWFGGHLAIKIGTQEINIPMGAESIHNNFHKLKFGRYEGVWLDDNFIEPFDVTDWSMSQNTIYIGAMHNHTNGDENGVWRPWNGYIGNVKIYGEKNGEVRDFTFTCGDFGRWGEYETDGNILPNLMGDGGAILNCCKQYGDKPFDGYRSVSVNINLKSINITENGRYSTDDQILIDSLRYNGGYQTDTISTYDINRIEVTFKADTSGPINGQGRPFILGGSLWGLSEESGEENTCARAIQYAYGRIVGYWEGKWTDATSCLDGEWLTIILDENGMTVKYPNYEYYLEYTHNNGKVNGGGDIFPFIIGGQGRRSGENGNFSSSLIEDTQFRGLIKEVKINTNSMGEVIYIPKNYGYGVWDRKIENTGEFISALEPTEGEITFNSEWERKYGEGWKEINVNVSGGIGILNYQEISYSDYLALGDNVDDNIIYLIR